MLDIQIPDWVAPLFSHRLKVPEAEWAATLAAVGEIAAAASRTEELLARGGTVQEAADAWFTPAEADRLLRTLEQAKSSGVFLSPNWSRQLGVLGMGLEFTCASLAEVAWRASAPDERSARFQQFDAWAEVVKSRSVGSHDELTDRVRAITEAESQASRNLPAHEVEEIQRGLPAPSPEQLRQMRVQVRHGLAILLTSCARIEQALNRVHRWRPSRTK